MNEFKAELARFLEGNSELSRLESVLSQTLQANPAAGPQILQMLDQLFRASRLPARAYIELKQRIPESPPLAPSQPTQGSPQQPQVPPQPTQGPPQQPQVPPQAPPAPPQPPQAGAQPPGMHDAEAQGDSDILDILGAPSSEPPPALPGASPAPQTAPAATQAPPPSAPPAPDPAASPDAVPSSDSGILDILGEPSGAEPPERAPPTPGLTPSEAPPSEDKTVFRESAEQRPAAEPQGAPPSVSDVSAGMEAPGEPAPSEDKTVFRQSAPARPEKGESLTGDSASNFTGATGPTGATGATGPSRVPGYTGRSGPTGTGSSWTDPSKWGDEPAPVMQAGSLLKDRYVLETVIGRGGMGVVFKARDLRREEAQDRNPHIAVKILNDEFRRHPESLKALQRESRKAQDLAHPNIVTVFDFDRDGTTVYMTMEFLEGQSLDRITKGASFDGMPIEEAFPLIEGLGRALAYAHNKGVVHSDFKPANVFLTKGNVIKVFDFGIARAAKLPGEKGGEVTRFDPGTLGALTPAYASCEMLDGETPDARDDIYALACVTYEMLTGRHPFDKRAADDARDKGLTPRQIKGLSRRQWRGLSMGLAFQRDARSPNVATFIEDLRPRKISRTTMGLGAAAGVAAILFGVFVVPGIIEERRIDGMIVELAGGTNATIPGALEKAGTFTPEQQQAIFADSAVEDTLIEYYVERIYAAQDAQDFPTAEAIIAEAFSRYDDSNRLADAKEQVEAIKADLLANLNDRFNIALDQGRLLPSEGDDISDVLSDYERIDPSNPALQDERLAFAYEKAVEAALESDVLLARQYLDEGQGRFPANTTLVDLRDRLNMLLEVQDREVRVAELQQSLGALLDSASGLEDLAPMERDLLQLATLDADNALLERYRAQSRGLFDARIDSAIASKDWLDARRIVETFGGLVTQDAQSAATARIDSAENAFLEQVGTVYASLLDAAQGGDFATAKSRLGELEQQGSDATTIREARQAINRGYERRAEAQRTAGDFQQARATVQAGRDFDTGFPAWDRLLDAIRIDEQLRDANLAEAERQRIESERLAQEQERFAQVESLQNDINRRLQATQGFDIAAARETISRIDELAALDSSAPLVSGGRAEVAAKLEAEANALGLRDSRWDEAIALIDAAIELIPGAPRLRQARDTLVSEQRSYRAKLAAEREQTLRADLDNLVRSPAYTPEWENSVRRAIQELAPLPGAQGYLQATRAKVAEGFVDEARTFLEQNRFDRAEQLLKSSTWFVPDFGPAATLREQLTQARTAFESERREQELDARIKGLKRTFETELAAEGIAAAKNARQTLQALLPANDPFLTTDAPQAIADTYLKMATRALAESRFDRAAELAQEGLGEVSDHAELRGLLSQITESRLAYNTEQLENVLANAPPTDAVGPRNMLGTIRNDARDDFPAIEANLRKLADQRVAKAGKDRDAVIDWISKIFPDYQPPALAGPPCNSGLAGYGGRARGRCYDYLPDSRTAGPRLVVVPAGAGVSTPFAITRQEISVGDWNAYCRISGQCTPRQGESDDIPITNISVSDAVAYAGWLTSSTEHEYRLPTEAEWVLAASAESRGKISPNCLNPQAGTGDTLLEVNRGGQNDYGLMNYVGNAQEWVAGPSGSYTARGGAYRDRLGTCAIDLARPHSGTADEITGFRLVRELDGGA